MRQPSTTVPRTETEANVGSTAISAAEENRRDSTAARVLSPITTQSSLDEVDLELASNDRRFSNWTLQNEQIVQEAAILTHDSGSTFIIDTGSVSVSSTHATELVTASNFLQEPCIEEHYDLLSRRQQQHEPIAFSVVRVDDQFDQIPLHAYTVSIDGSESSFEDEDGDYEDVENSGVEDRNTSPSHYPGQDDSSMKGCSHRGLRLVAMASCLCILTVFFATILARGIREGTSTPAAELHTSSAPSVVPRGHEPALVSPTDARLGPNEAAPRPPPTQGTSPSDVSSLQPIHQPALTPSIEASTVPSIAPTKLPISFPTTVPTETSSFFPSIEPSQQPALHPSWMPTIGKSKTPSLVPTSSPSLQQTSFFPTSVPSVVPTSRPSAVPSKPGKGGLPPATVQPLQAFGSAEELRKAVDSYLYDSSPRTAVAVLYGWPISMWQVGGISDFSHLFSELRNPAARNFNQALHSWDTSSAITMEGMFFGATSFNQELSQWNVSRVEQMSYMFHGAASFDQDLSLWDVSRVRSMQYMFSYALSFEQDLCHWGYELQKNRTKLEGMFVGTQCASQSSKVPTFSNPIVSESGSTFELCMPCNIDVATARGAN